MADSRERITAALTSATATDDLQLRGQGAFTVFISGTFSATVNIQASKPGAASYVDLTDLSTGSAYAFTAPALHVGELPGQWDIRANVSSYTSGTVNIELTPYRDKARGV